MNRQPPRAHHQSESWRFPAGVSLALALSLGALIAGCGNRGPLYLPETTDPAVGAPASPAQASKPHPGASGDANSDEESDEEEDSPDPRGA